MSSSRADLIDAMGRLSVASAAVANFCDHAEHNEHADLADVRQAAAELRGLAVFLSHAAGHDPVDLYAQRLSVIEARNVLHTETSLDGAVAAREARTLRDLQLVQAKHDHAYHADVAGLTKADQLRHYALHLAKLAGATAAVARGEEDEADWLCRRVPDMLLFGLKLSTVTGERLPMLALSEAASPDRSLRAAA